MSNFIAEIWAKETREALDFMKKVMGAMPELPHRQRFLWWHRHFCQECEVYREEWRKVWAAHLEEGLRVQIPNFSSLMENPHA